MDPNPFISVRPPTKEFIEWCQKDTPEAGLATSFQKILQQPDRHMSQKETFDFISKDATEHLVFNQNITETGCVFNAEEQNEKKKIIINHPSTFTIKNLKSHELHLSHTNLTLINCADSTHKCNGWVDS